MIQIPVTNQPNQRFKVTLPIGNANITLDFSVWWNRIAGYWQMSIADANGVDLIVGQPMITGQTPAGNLLRQQAYLGIGSAFVAPISNDAPDYPGVDDWDTNFILLWSE